MKKIMTAFLLSAAFLGCKNDKLSPQLKNADLLKNMNVTQNVINQINAADAQVDSSDRSRMIPSNEVVAHIWGHTKDGNTFIIELSDQNKDYTFSENESYLMERQFPNEYFNILRWKSGMPYNDFFQENVAGLTTTHNPFLNMDTKTVKTIMHSSKIYKDFVDKNGRDSTAAIFGNEHMSIKKFLTWGQ